jgi:transposase-like protein
MPNRVHVLTIPDTDRVKLERRVRDRSAPARVAKRARIVLLSADGLTGPQIAQRVGCTEPTVVKWRRQYAEDGLAGCCAPLKSGRTSSALRCGRGELPADGGSGSARIRPAGRALSQRHCRP